MKESTGSHCYRWAIGDHCYLRRHLLSSPFLSTAQPWHKPSVIIILWRAFIYVVCLLVVSIVPTRGWVGDHGRSWKFGALGADGRRGGGRCRVWLSKTRGEN